MSRVLRCSKQSRLRPSFREVPGLEHTLLRATPLRYGLAITIASLLPEPLYRFLESHFDTVYLYCSHLYILVPLIALFPLFITISLEAPIYGLLVRKRYYALLIWTLRFVTYPGRSAGTPLKIPRSPLVTTQYQPGFFHSHVCCEDGIRSKKHAFPQAGA